jgi:hypothetical protein
MPPLSDGSAYSPDDHLNSCGAFLFLELCGFRPSILASPELKSAAVGGAQELERRRRGGIRNGGLQ